MEEFLIYFRSKKQWIKVILEDVHPNTFERWKGGRWGYFQATWENPKVGEFGEVHFVKSRVREDVVAHEMFHVTIEWMWANRDNITSRNEERYAEFHDRLVGQFYKEFKKNATYR